MYLKLAFRNAKRSGQDYLIYMVTLIILIAIMMLSNSISTVGNMEAGFQTSSLPLMITIIMVVLLNYINRFILTQRAKEFATYILMGMEKNKLSWMFFFEFLFLGVICFVFGIILGFLLFCTLNFLFSNFIGINSIQFVYIIKAIAQTSVYFIIIEILSLLNIKRIINHLQINQLMITKKTNETLKNAKTNRLWMISTIISFILFYCLLIGIVFLPENMGMMLISFISLPLLLFIFSFYKTIFIYGNDYRFKKHSSLYNKNRLYIIGQIFSNIKTNALINSILCICLLFSLISFIFGNIMLQPSVDLMEHSSQTWMGFLQICICIIFIVLFFSILSVQQIIEMQKESHSMKILQYIGKTKKQVQKLILTQISLKFSIPVILCALFLIIAAPLVNYKIDIAFNTSSMVMKSVTGFLICFISLYSLYCYIVYHTSKKHIN